MDRRKFLVVAVGAVPLGLGLLPAASGGPAAQQSVVRIGLVGSMFRDTPEPLIQVMIRPLKSLLEGQTGVTGQVIPGADAETLGRQLKDDQVQLGIFHGFEFAWARLKNPGLKPLLIAVHERRFLTALLVVRKDCPAADPADLHGKVVALPRLSREHCRMFLERRCTRPGCTAKKSFAEVTAPADIEDALDAVVDGQAAAAIVDGVGMQGYAREKPGRARKLRTLRESEPFPCAVVAYQPGVLDEGLLERFRDGMIAAKASPRGRQLLDMCRISSFETVPADYEQMLNDIAKAYPPAAK